MFGRGKHTKQDLVTRYEAKYIISPRVVPEIRSFIRPFCRPDPYASGDPPEYTITTLQLDNDAFALHWAKENESISRFKLRVRTYGDVGASPVFAEVKTKLEHTIVKARAAVPFGVWDEDLLFGVRLPDCFRSVKQEIDFLNFKRLVWQIGARPKVLIRYIRESYVGAVDRYARITFDRALQYQVTGSWTDFGRSGQWRNMDSTEAQGFGLPFSGIVMEVKTLSHTPMWVMDMVERFELQKRGNCKYSTAVWREGVFTGCPPTNSAAEENLAFV